MNPNYPGGDPTNPGDPNNPPSYPQQPGYGQQPPPQYPQQPVQPPQKKSNRGLIIGCSIAAVVVLLICGGVGAALYIGAHKVGDTISSAGNAAAALGQVELFCTDYTTQNYGSAYQLLSKAEQGRVNQTQFTTHAAALDTSAGNVATCSEDPNHTFPDVSSDGKTATATVQVARGSNASLVAGTVNLVYEDGAWKIDSADASLTLF